MNSVLKNVIKISFVLIFYNFSQINSKCLTLSFGRMPCAFPYKINGSLEFTCTREYNNDSRLEGWCPTKVDPQTLEGSDWYECSSDSVCPLMRYHKHEELMGSLNDLVNEYPSLAVNFTIGTSTLERPLVGIRISEGVRNQGRKLLKPMVKLLANMHGNEPVGRELLIHMAKHLLGNYGKEDRITQIVNTIDLWVIPTLNPDGFARAKEGSCEGGGYPEGRYNEGGKDLNRDFPTWKDVNKTNLESSRQKETVLLMRLIKNHPFVLSANFHDGAVLVNYPWDDYHSDDRKTWHGINKAPDHDMFYHLSTTYSLNHPIMPTPKACTKWGIMKNGITNGAQWYPVIGGMQDYNYLYSNAMEMTMELSCCKFPPRKYLIREWERNRESILKYIEQVHLSVKGLIIDSQNSRVPEAIVKVRHPITKEPLGKPVMSAKTGEYWKLLLPGNSYEIMASKKLADGKTLESKWNLVRLNQVPHIMNIKIELAPR